MILRCLESGGLGLGLLLWRPAPFHAAGDHSNGSTKNTLSQAISSYIPTLKALSYAREKKIELFNGDSSLLLVTMPDTPGNDCHLLNVDQEANNITDTLDGTDCSVELLRHPSATEVLKRLETCDTVHFACHGISKSNDPSESHLLLYNGSDPRGSVSKLTVGEISRANIKKAQIAYLSACSTARNDHEGLANESIHIASGFQLAGFSHVLGTLWESDDNACIEISRDFYRLLFAGDNVTTIKKDGGTGMLACHSTAQFGSCETTVETNHSCGHPLSIPARNAGVSGIRRDHVVLVD